MGLDATVFKNLAHIDKSIDRSLLSYDETTGHYWVEMSGGRYPRDLFVAEERRLGNAANIVALRAELEEMNLDVPILLNKVVYDFSHCGDILPFSEIDALEHEVNLVKEQPNLSSFMAEFIESMEALIRAAKENQNPICF
jgi:hypothetical protein